MFILLKCMKYNIFCRITKNLSELGKREGITVWVLHMVSLSVSLYRWIMHTACYPVPWDIQTGHVRLPCYCCKYRCRFKILGSVSTDMIILSHGLWLEYFDSLQYFKVVFLPVILKKVSIKNQSILTVDHHKFNLRSKNLISQIISPCLPGP